MATNGYLGHYGLLPGVLSANPGNGIRQIMYYDDGWVSIYQGNCLDILALIDLSAEYCKLAQKRCESIPIPMILT